MSYRDIGDRCSKIHKTLETLGPSLFLWADRERITAPLQRTIDRYLTRLNNPDDQWATEVLYTMSALRVMGNAKVAKRFLKAEDELPARFTGDELQLVNNVLYHSPWDFGMFWILEQKAEGLFLAEEVGTRRNVLLYNPELLLALEQDKELVAGVIVPSGPNSGNRTSSPKGTGDLSLSPRDIQIETEIEPDQTTHELPVYTLFDSFTAFNTFLQDDPLQLLHFFAKHKLSDPPTRQQVQTIMNANAPGLMLLGIFGDRDDFLEDDEVMARIAGAMVKLPQPGLEAPVLSELEKHLFRRNHEQWSLFEGMYGEESLHILYLASNRTLYLRATGQDAREAYKTLRNIIAECISEGCEDSTKGAELLGAMPVNPPMDIGMVCGFAARDVFGLDLLSPPERVLQYFDLPW